MQGIRILRWNLFDTSYKNRFPPLRLPQAKKYQQALDLAADKIAFGSHTLKISFSCRCDERCVIIVTYFSS